MQRISQAAKAMLEDTILPFWMALRDDEHGGYYGYMDFDPPGGPPGRERAAS